MKRKFSEDIDPSVAVCSYLCKALWGIGLIFILKTFIANGIEGTMEMGPFIGAKGGIFQ